MKINMDYILISVYIFLLLSATELISLMAFNSLFNVLIFMQIISVCLLLLFCKLLMVMKNNKQKIESPILKKYDAFWLLMFEVVALSFIKKSGLDVGILIYVLIIIKIICQIFIKKEIYNARFNN